MLACALQPLGGPLRGPLPAGVHDVGVEVWSQPDAFTAVDPPGRADDATAGARRPHPGGAVEAAAAGSLLTDGGRLFSEANPASPPGVASFTEPLVRGGSLVLVAHPDPGRLEATYAAERATAPGLSAGGLSPTGSSARQVVAPIPLAQVARRATSAARAVQR